MLTSDEIKDCISKFKTELWHCSPLDLIRKRIIYGGCAILGDDAYLELRSEIANHFGLHPNQILVVGSSKLGFSIAPTKRYQPFSDTSDIDVVLVSDKLFSTVWEEVFQFDAAGGYWEKRTKFKDYLFQGWIRPDKLPPSAMFTLAKDWWDFFRYITASKSYGGIKIAGALYYNWNYLESYQLRSVVACKNNLESEVQA